MTVELKAKADVSFPWPYSVYENREAHGRDVITCGGTWFYIGSGTDVAEIYPSCASVMFPPSPGYRMDSNVYTGDITGYVSSFEVQVGGRVIAKDISVDNLIAAMNATDEEVDQWLAALLRDYDIEVNADNIGVIRFLIGVWLKQQVSKSGLTLQKEELSKLFKFVARLAHDVLYVGSI